jgi:hypothetical protein
MGTSFTVLRDLNLIGITKRFATPRSSMAGPAEGVSLRFDTLWLP